MSDEESTTPPGADGGGVTASVAPAPPGSGPSEGTPYRVGQVVDGKYRLEAVLGSGGMGIVFEATHLALGERVAIKLVLEGAGGERLRREARIALRMRGEHVVRVMDVGTLPSGAPYVVMEHLLGQNLAAVARASGPLPIDDAVDYVLQACEAMAEAHAQGVVHRDLKPGNLFLARRPDGSPLVKVLDFGIAKAQLLRSASGAPLDSLTGSSAVLGSPRYMSPEQVRGAKTVDARADVWALGVILHELIAGAPPFGGDAPSAVLAAIAADPPARLRTARADAPEALEEAILRCLEKDPEKRTSSVGALAAAIAPFAPPRSRTTLDRIAGIAAPKRARVDALPAAGARVDAPVAISVATPLARRPWRWVAALGVLGALAALLVARFRAPAAAPPRVSISAPLDVTARTTPAAQEAVATATAQVGSAPTSAPRPAGSPESPPLTTAPEAKAPPPAAPMSSGPRAPARRPGHAADRGADVEAATAERH